MKKFIAIADVHGETKYINKLYSFIKDFNPDYFIINGDLCDFSVISEYERHKRNAIGINTVINTTLKEIECCKQIIKTIEKNLPKVCKKIFIEGNHDARYEKFFTYDYPQKDKKDLLSALEMNNWQFIKLGGFYKLGKLYFMHGEKFNGDFYTKAACMKLRKNVRLGHHHTNQSYMITTPLDSTDITECKAFGCLCEKDPVYLKGITNRWINSFLAGYIYNDEKYQDFIVNIINGKFVAPNGKIYV